MNYYLIDFENIGLDGLKRVVDIAYEGTIEVFYSEKCKNVTFDIIASIFNKDLQLQCNKAITGVKNSLDFQLSSYLGYLIGKNKDSSNYFIISNDKGYECISAYWKNKGVNIKLISSSELSQDSLSLKTKLPSNSKISTLEEIKELISPKENPEKVLEIFNSNKSKVEINNKLVKLYKDTKKSGEVYKKLKPLLKKKGKK